MDRREFLFATSSCLLAGGCRLTERGGNDRGYALRGDGRLTVDWPGLEEPLRFWVIGDTHFALRDARDEEHAEQCARMSRWAAAKEPFEAMLARAKEENPDLLVLVGDILSFPTLANVEYLKSSLDRCGLPWIYVAGNHDWHFEGDGGSDLEQRARWTECRLKPLYQGSDPLMASRVVKGVRFVMIDNSLYHVLPEQLSFFKTEAAKGDPVCLCMHIPLWRPGWGVHTCGCPTWGAATDPYWRIERRERWSERQMPSTFAFREAVLETSNLVGVFAGHIHALEVARERGQNFFTTPGNGNGAHLSVTIDSNIQ